MTASAMLARPVRTTPDARARHRTTWYFDAPAVGRTLPLRQLAAGVQPRLCIPVGRGMTEPP